MGRSSVGVAKVGYIAIGDPTLGKRLVTADVSNQRIKDALVKILQNAGIRDFEIMVTFENPTCYIVHIKSER